MGFIEKIFNRKEKSITTYHDFWKWFCKNEQRFFETVKTGNNIHKHFLDKLAPKLAEVKSDMYCVTGMFGDNTAELILTPEGIIKNIVFAEEIVAAAPQIKRWKFTALKPQLSIENVNIDMDGYAFKSDNIWFYANDNAGYPDEIDIVIVYDNFNEKDKSIITNGVFIFLDNYLGELNFSTTIDNIKLTGKEDATEALIPIHKLKDFLNWRQKEFIEKYDGMRHNTEEDNYASFEAELENGNYLIATMNTDLLEWDEKASHPWIGVFEIKYDGTDNGLPDESTYAVLNDIEDEIAEQLKDYEGFLNVGRETADNKREIYFACKDFRKVAKVFYAVQNKYASLFDISYDIYKDKYWRTFNRFMIH